MLVMSMTMSAQTVGYTYRPLAAKGCRMEYGIVRQDSAWYIMTIVESDRLKFLKESMMKIRTFDGEVMELDGSLVSTDTESCGYVLGTFMVPVTAIYSTALFKITSKQLELLKNGIAKIRLSTIPIEHEKEFHKDKIGKKLYQLYLKKENQEAF